ncbi:MAG: hypothetical protein WA354_05915, partial [Terracidiphilus sp.]
DATNAARNGLPGQNLRWLRKVTTMSLCNRAGRQPASPRRISSTIATSSRQQQPALTRLPPAKTWVRSENDTTTSQQFAVWFNDHVQTVWDDLYYPAYLIPSTPKIGIWCPK